MSVVFHSPPSTPPTQMVLWVASEESTRMALTRPEATPLFGRVFPLLLPTTSLLGPLSTHVVIVDLELKFLKAAFSFDFFVISMAAMIFSLGTFPVVGSFVL